MQQRATYTDVVGEVRDELAARVETALAAGIAADRLAIDPGLGFAKTAEHNWELLRRLDELDVLGMPVLVGSSRKSFLGSLLASTDGDPRPVDDREDATTALTALAGILERARDGRGRQLRRARVGSKTEARRLGLKVPQRTACARPT